MLSLVIASSILALMMLAAAIAELFCRWVIKVAGKRAASRPVPNHYETDNRLSLLEESNQYQAR